MSIIFKCSHCETEKEYTLDTLNNIHKDAKVLREHTVCAGCYAKYSRIDVKVKEIAEKERQELEKDFFKSNENTIEPNELDELLENDEIKEPTE